MTKKSKKQKIRADLRKQRVAVENHDHKVTISTIASSNENQMAQNQIPRYTIPSLSNNPKPLSTRTASTYSVSLSHDLRKIVFLSLVAFSLEGIVYWAVMR